MGWGNAGLGGYPLDPQPFIKSPNGVSPWILSTRTLERAIKKHFPSPFIAFKFLILLCTHNWILFFIFFISTVFDSHSSLSSLPHLGFYFVSPFFASFDSVIPPLFVWALGNFEAPLGRFPFWAVFWVMCTCLGAGKIRMPRNRDFPCSPLFFSLSCSLDRTEDSPFHDLFSFLFTWSIIFTIFLFDSSSYCCESGVYMNFVEQWEMRTQRKARLEETLCYVVLMCLCSSVLCKFLICCCCSCSSFHGLKHWLRSGSTWRTNPMILYRMISLIEVIDQISSWFWYLNSFSSSGTA